MQEVNLFLASSLTELPEERQALEAFLYQVTKIYEKRGIFVHLFNCEFFNTAIGKRRKQEEYTIEEFNIAYKLFQDTEAPSILIYFKQGEKQPEQNLLDFKEYLEDEEQIGHYVEYYSHVDTIKLKLLIQFMLMNLDIPVELEDSAVRVGGKPVLTLENIPMWANNENFQSLKAQYQECERVYLDAKANTTDPVADSVFLRASERWNEAKKAMQELEQQLFSIALKIQEKNNDDSLTERQRKAYELLEQGDSEGANRILDLREILDDVAHVKKLRQQTGKTLEQHVQELLQKIEILQTQTDKPERFAEIRNIFEHAVKLEEEEHLEKVAMRNYLSYLKDQNDYRTAILLAEKFLKYMELESTEYDIADAVNILGILYKNTNRPEQAEEEYLRAKEICEQLAEENPAAYLPDLASTCNNLESMKRKKYGFFGYLKYLFSKLKK